MKKIMNNKSQKDFSIICNPTDKALAEKLMPLLLKVHRFLSFELFLDDTIKEGYFKTYDNYGMPFVIDDVSLSDIIELYEELNTRIVNISSR